MIGIMGVGKWGQNHVRVLAQLRAEEIIDDFAIIDVDRSRVKYYSKLYGCRGYESLSDALKAEVLDGLIIATPTRLHYAHAKEALTNGLHVLVEKPIATTSMEALELIKISEENNRILMTGFLLRYSPAVQYVKRILETDPKYFGSLLSISVKRLNPWQAKEFQTGVIMDLVIHDVDLASYIFEATPRRVYANTIKLGFDFEVYATGFVEYESTRCGGVILTFEAGSILPQKFRDWIIFGTEKIVQLDLTTHVLRIYTRGETSSPAVLGGSDPLYSQDKNFAEAIQGKVKPLITGYDGYKALKTCEALIQSAESKSTVEITFSPSQEL